MSDTSLERLTDYRQFCDVEAQWQEFTETFFPGNYSKTFPWLAAWWESYLGKGPASVYLQRGADGKIQAAAPFYSRWGLFGGLPVRMLHLVGHGIGTDDLMIASGERQFLPALFSRMAREPWHVARFHRVRNTDQLGSLLEAAGAAGCSCTVHESLDYLIDLPADFQEYLRSRTRKFRRNLNQAENRLNRMGQVEFVVLDPYRDTGRVIEAGARIAQGSWQFKKGLSHFNVRDRATLYQSLTSRGAGAGGEDFNLLLVDGKPVAYLLGCRRQRTYYAVDTAFHEDYRGVSAGRLLFNRIIERLIAEGEVDQLDFEGAGEYKDDYANRTLAIRSVTVYSRSWYARLVRRFKESALFAKLKELLKGSSSAAGSSPVVNEE